MFAEACLYVRLRRICPASLIISLLWKWNNSAAAYHPLTAAVEQSRIHGKGNRLVLHSRINGDPPRADQVSLYTHLQDRLCTHLADAFTSAARR